MRRIILLVFLALSTAVYAQKPATTTATAAAETTATATPMATLSTDSHETKRQFKELLERTPPQVGVILKLDPTLFNNQQFLATYPGVADFVAKHPEVPHNPGFYLSSVWIPSEGEPRSASQRMWQETME